MPFGIGTLLKMVSPCGFQLLTGSRLPRDRQTATLLTNIAYYLTSNKMELI